MCSTGQFQFRWLRGYIHSSCYYNLQIGSINLTHYHIFPWFCAWDVCYIIYCHLLHIHSGKKRAFVFIIIVHFMMSANIQIHFGLQIVFVCLYITLIIINVQTYLKTLNLLNACQMYFVECVSKITHIFSAIHCLLFSVYLFPLWWLR